MGKEVGAAWVVILAEGTAGIKMNKMITVCREVDLKTMEKRLDKPNMLVGQLCGLLCEAGGLGWGI